MPATRANAQGPFRVRAAASTSPDGSPGAMLREYALLQLSLAIQAIGHEGRQRQVGIHETRKSLRRAAASLDLSRRRMPAAFKRARTAIMKAYRHLSPLRDAQAVIEALDLQIKATSPGAKLNKFKLMRRKLAVRRTRELRRMLDDDPALRRFRHDLDGLPGLVKALPWEGIGLKNIRSALDRAGHRTRRAAHRAKKRQSAASRHRWRCWLRRLLHQYGVIEWIFAQCATGSAMLDKAQAPRLLSLRAERSFVHQLSRRSEALGLERDLRLLCQE